MTDLSSFTPASPRPRHGRRRTLEFGVYFTLIFLLALPGGGFTWIRDIVRNRTLNLKGPMARAWAEADRVTPLIFSV
ncbi:MAG: cytochrome PufQ [Pseudomonadota bacterium]